MHKMADFYPLPPGVGRRPNPPGMISEQGRRCEGTRLFIIAAFAPAG